MSSRTLSAMGRLHTGASIPLFGLGTWKSEKESVADVVRSAINMGYRHIDCAAVYGNEAEIGPVFHDLVTPHRADFFITSKLWNADHRPDRVRPALLKTLKDLQLEYLDLYLIHWPVALVPGTSKVEDVPLIDTWRELEKLVDDKLVRHIGVSNFSPLHLTPLIPLTRIPIAVNQIELHPYLPQHALVSFCQSRDIHVTAYSPLGSGGSKPCLLEDEEVKKVAGKVGKSVAQVVLKWGIERGTSVIPKTVKVERLKENSMLDFDIDREDMEKISSLGVEKRYVPDFWNSGCFDE